jgi:hypothetical protein
MVRMIGRDPTTHGKEVFDLKPIILGGDPTDPRNKIVVDRKRHIELVRYWNRVIRQLKNQNRR